MPKPLMEQWKKKKSTFSYFDSGKTTVFNNTREIFFIELY